MRTLELLRALGFANLFHLFGLLQLGGLIDRGEFREGDRLPPERELSKKLGVSRPVVREAMIALEIAGLGEF